MAFNSVYRAGLGRVGACVRGWTAGCTTDVNGGVLPFIEGVGTPPAGGVGGVPHLSIYRELSNASPN